MQRQLIRYLSLLMLLLGSIGTWAQGSGDFDPTPPPEPPAPVIKTRLLLIASPTDGGTLSGGGDYEKETVVAVKATPNTNFKFVQWTRPDGTLVSTAANFNFTKGEHRDTLVAHFEYSPATPAEPSEPNLPEQPKYHSVTAQVSPVDGGSVTIDAANVQEGARTRIRVSTNTGFRFLGLFVADTLYTTSTDFYYTMETADIHFVAKYEFNPGTPVEPSEPDSSKRVQYHKVTVRATPSDGGTITTESTTVAEGSRTRIRVSTNTGFSYLGTYVADTLYTTSADFYYTMGTTDTDFEARFEYSPGTPVEPNSSGLGKYTFYLSTVRGLPGRTVQYPVFLSSLDSLSNVQFNLTFPRGATPNLSSVRLSGKAEGYAISFKLAEAAARGMRRAPESGETTYTLSLTGGRTPACTTRLLTFDLELSNDFAASDSNRVRINQIEVTTMSGDNQAAAASSGNITMREQSAEGTFYYLTIISTGNGQARVGSRIVRNAQYVYDMIEGSSSNVFFTPDDGYHVERVTIATEQGGEETEVTSQTTDGRYLVSNITSDMYLTVQYAEGASSAYTLSVTASGNGKVSFQEQEVRQSTQPFSVSHGTEAVFEITADTGYHLDQVLLDDTDVTSSVVNGLLTLETVTEAHSLNVTFAHNLRTLTVVATGGGTASFGETAIRNGMQTFQVEELSAPTISLAADTGYGVNQVLLGDTDVTSAIVDNAVTIASITSDTTVNVTFAPTNHTLSITSSANGHVTFNGTDVSGATQQFSVAELAEAALTIVPDAGYHIAGVTLGAEDMTEQLGEGGVLTIASISGDTAVSVTFEQTFHTLTVVAAGNGAATYGETVVRNATQTFQVAELAAVQVTIAADDGFHVGQVLLGSADVSADMADGVLSIESITSDTTVSVSFGQTFHTLSITSSANGHVTFNGTDVSGTTQQFSVAELAEAALTIVPDAGYHIAGVMLGTEDVTEQLGEGGMLTIASVTGDTAVSVTFEQTFHTLTVAATGNGAATYGETVVRNATQTFQVAELAAVAIDLTPNTDNHIATIMLNGTDVTESVDNGILTIASMTDDTKVDVVFAEDPHQFFTLQITAVGEGTIVCDDVITIEEQRSMTVRDDQKVNFKLIPAEGNKLDRVIVDNADLTGQVVEGQFGISGFTADCYVLVEYVSIAPPIVVPDSVILTIEVSGDGTVHCDDQQVMSGETEQIKLPKGANAVLEFIPGENYRLGKLTLNGEYVMPDVLGNYAYVLREVDTDSTLNVIFVEDVRTFTVDGINYGVIPPNSGNYVQVMPGDYSGHLSIPERVDFDGETWTVIGLAAYAFAQCNYLVTLSLPATLEKSGRDILRGSLRTAAIEWPSVNARMTEANLGNGGYANPNMLYYVADKAIAPEGKTNVIVNGIAETIVLSDAVEQCDFYCPTEFTARNIRYSHEYLMETGFNHETKGWETLTLPFDVQRIEHANKGAIVPFPDSDDFNEEEKHFWLFSMDENGWKRAEQIVANTPYIISMPQNPIYLADYQLGGNIVFSSQNVLVKPSSEMVIATHGTRSFIPCLQQTSKGGNQYALDAYNRYTGEKDKSNGSTFVINLRQVRPFEAYFTDASGNSRQSFGVFEDGDVTAIHNIPLNGNVSSTMKVYSIDGRLITNMPIGSSMNDMRHLPSGVYIINGRKIVIGH